MWTEYFGTKPTSCDLLPYSQVRFGTPSANNGASAPISHSNVLSSTADCKTSWASDTSNASGTIQIMGNPNYVPPVTTTPPVTVVPTDTTLPSVSIQKTTNGSTITSPVTIAASATDNVGVIRMDISLDGNIIKTASASSISTDRSFRQSKRAKNHQIKVTATDKAGNIGTVTYTVRY